MIHRSPLVWLWLTALVVLLDQATKYMIVNWLGLHESYAVIPGLSLTLVHNDGAAFSFLQHAGGWQRWFFISLSIVISTAIVVWLARLQSGRNWLACALALILGGALGNLWDRFTLGYVIDFILVYYQRWSWPAFNVADSAITVGAVMLIIDAIWLDRAEVSMIGKRNGS